MTDISIHHNRGPSNTADKTREGKRRHVWISFEKLHRKQVSAASLYRLCHCQASHNYPSSYRQQERPTEAAPLPDEKGSSSRRARNTTKQKRHLRTTTKKNHNTHRYMYICGAEKQLGWNDLNRKQQAAGSLRRAAHDTTNR